MVTASIDIWHILPHPNNPRQDLGDVSELAESIKAEGILQNLTIIPEECLNLQVEEQPEYSKIDPSGKFYCLIGHRRLKAAKKAGLRNVPCAVITKKNLSEQIGIMMEENMQRNDLTLYEQAQGFQMMFDLGSSVEAISEKTGFSTTTIYHRLNIAKLNQKVVENTEKNEDMQLTVKDYIELEKVKKISTRNKILKDARDSSNLRYLINQEVRQEKVESNSKKAIKILEKKGVKRHTGTYESWNNKYDEIKKINLENDFEDIKFKKTKEQLYYYIPEKLCSWNSSLHIFRKAEKDKCEKKKTDEELKREKEEKRRKKLQSICNDMKKKRKEFVRTVVQGNVEPVEDTKENRDVFWDTIVELNSYDIFLTKSTITREISNKEYVNMEESEQIKTIETFKQLGTPEKILIMISIANIRLLDYQGTYLTDEAEKLKKVYKILSMYGMSLTEEEQQMLDGTHELYAKEEK